MSIETGVLVGRNGPLYWHLPEGRNGGSLPDSRDLWWDGFWAHRDSLVGFAHSHPGKGVPAPSDTDITTFSAVEKGLGKKIHWWIISNDYWVHCFWSGPGKYDYMTIPLGPLMVEYIPWLGELRDLSNYKEK